MQFKHCFEQIILERCKLNIKKGKFLMIAPVNIFGKSDNCSVKVIYKHMTSINAKLDFILKSLINIIAMPKTTENMFS